MQISRLLEIVYVLMEKRNVTAAELARRFEVSPRTVYRDIDALAAAGIPVYAGRGKGGGIRLMPGFVLDKSFLTEKEQNEILFALQSLRMAGAGGDSVLPRLKSLFRREQADWIDIDFSDWGSCDAEKRKFSILKTGILERQVVSFTYYGASGEKSIREAEPVKLRFKNGAWYMHGFCRKKNAFRIFKIRRMEDVRLTAARFVQRCEPLPELDSPDAANGRPVCLELLFSPDAAFRAYDMFSSRDIERNADGSLTVRVRFPEDAWVYSMLLSFGSSVTVVSPRHVRRILREHAEKMADLYKD